MQQPDTYRSHPAMNWSRLKAYMVDALQFAHNEATPFEPTDAVRIGDAIDVMTLTPEAYDERFAVWVGGRRYGKEWDAWSAENAAKVQLSMGEADRARAASRALLSNREAQRYLCGGSDRLVQEAFWWTNATTGIECKGRCDLIVDDVLVECKSTGAANLSSRGKWEAHSARSGYHGQMAFYYDGLIASGHDIRRVVQIVVSNAAPYRVAVLEVLDDVISAGRELYHDCLAQHVECTEAGVWSAWCDVEGGLVLELPAWAQADIELNWEAA